MLSLKNDVLRVQVNPFGAELHSVRLAGEERLWQGDPAVWSGRAPVLFPVAGSFLNGRYRYAGKEYAMRQHGFAKERLFRVLAHEARSLSLLLEGREENYPFDYRLIVRFSLPEKGAALRVTYRVENPGGRALYFTLGAHEAYACPAGIDACKVTFSADDVLREGVLCGTQLVRGERRLRVLDRRTLPLRGDLFLNDAIVLPDLRSRSVLLRCGGEQAVRVDFPDFPCLLLWQVPGAKFLAVEPWTSPPEYTDHDGALARKPGVQRLRGGEGRDYTHTITFL